MSFISESISTGFGVDGVTIEQTLLNTFDPYSGMDIDTTIFQNTNQSLEDSNNDGRIELGMFSFNDDNLASNNFPNVLGQPFIGIIKRNMVNNGDCKFIEKSYYEDRDEMPIVVKPEGEWRFLSLLEYKDGDSDLDFLNSDEQGFLPYGGRYNYVPLSLEQDGDAGLSYWGKVTPWPDSFGAADRNQNLQKLLIDYPTDTFSQDMINTVITLGSADGNPIGAVRDFHRFKINTFDTFADMDNDSNLSADDYAIKKEVPMIAHWLVTPEAYSNNRCLCFYNYRLWDIYKVLEYTTQHEDYPDGYVFNWLADFQYHSEGLINLDVPLGSQQVNAENQYRVLNQVQKIYDKFNDEPINPYSSLKIRFKMKTTNVLPPVDEFVTDNEKQTFMSTPLDKDLGFAPQVEVGILGSQFEETPKTGKKGLPFAAGTDIYLNPIRLLDGNEYFKAPGSWNSQRHYNGDSFEEKNYSELGGMNRFQNSTMNEWETFEFTYNLSMEHNNRGEIYGVKYGGSFDDDLNGGTVEIMLNHRADSNGLPNPNSGEIYFKVPGYQDNPISGDQFYMTSPDGESVFVRHGVRGGDNNDSYDTGIGYMTVCSDLGDSNTIAVKTNSGLQDDGRFLEAYLMYVGGLNFKMNDNTFESPETHLGYGQDTGRETDMVVAYWDGERWSYDSNLGYNARIENDSYIYNDNFFNPSSDCFIIARLYSTETEEENGIIGIDQYINNEVQFPTDGVGNLSLFLQSGNNFNGRVLIDDIECYESYEFTPEVDVRKKKSVGNYGLADLTKYYDKELHPIQYKDSQAPLEAQFYFYPQYPTNETFIERTPIYQDFRRGRFYIYDVNWGDGTPNEFTSEPEQIDENTALYHTYESNGVFEVNGTMIRVKTDKDDKIIGVAYNKKFKLRININEGNDEDFQYFGSDGYSFIPFKETVPIIGGISKQSNYYKSIKRQLGFLGNEKINIEFKNKSDKLKTELALLKMENQDIQNLEVLPNYLVSRTEIIDKLLYPGTPDTFNEGGQNFDYNQKNGPFYWNTDELEINTENIPREIIKIIRITMVDNSTIYKISATYDTVAEEWTGSLSTLLYENSVFFIFELDSEMVDSDGFYWEAIQFQNQNPIIYNGISPIKEELGKGIGDCDITNIKYYNEPKSIWEMFGFEENDLNIIGKPDEPRYWKNIIPKDYSIFNREGVNSADVSRENLTSLPFPQYFEEFNIFNEDNLLLAPYGWSFHDGYYTGKGAFRPDIAYFIAALIAGAAPQFSQNYDFPSYTNNWSSLDDIPFGNGLQQPVENFFNPTNFGIDIYSNQDWIGTDVNHPNNFHYYYPVLPKYGADGKFVVGNLPQASLSDLFLPQHLATLPFPQYKEEFNADGNVDDDGNVLINAFDATTWGRLEDGLVRPDISDLIAKLSVGAPPSPDYIYPAYVDNWSNLNSIPSGNGLEQSVTLFRNIAFKIPFSLGGSITDENESDKNLLINIINEKNDVEVFNDKSGNKNYGFSIEDFSPKYDEKTLRVKKNKSKSIFKTSKPNGAF